MGALGPIRNRKTEQKLKIPKPETRNKFRWKPKTGYTRTIKTKNLHTPISNTPRSFRGVYRTVRGRTTQVKDSGSNFPPPPFPSITSPCAPQKGLILMLKRTLWMSLIHHVGPVTYCDFVTLSRSARSKSRWLSGTRDHPCSS